MYRVFETLDALVTVVEEARGLPMTANCVVPRGELLDLLDELREALPGELDDAQDVLDQRDEMLSAAERRAEEVTAQADQDAEKLVADARAQHQDLVERARAEAERLTEAGQAEYERAVAEGRAEQARLVAQTEVVQAAHIESGRIIDAGEREAARLRAECDQYIDSSLSSFEDTLTRTLQTVRRGRGLNSSTGERPVGRQRAEREGWEGHAGRGRLSFTRGRERLGTDLLD